MVMSSLWCRSLLLQRCAEKKDENREWKPFSSISCSKTGFYLGEHRSYYVYAEASRPRSSWTTWTE